MSLLITGCIENESKPVFFSEGMHLSSNSSNIIQNSKDFTKFYTFQISCMLNGFCGSFRLF